MAEKQEPKVVDSDSDSSGEYEDAVEGPALPNLLKFTEVFNIKDFVEKQIANDLNSEDAKKQVIDSAKVVGQERDGSIIFTYVLQMPSSEDTEEESFMTMVAAYTLNQPSFKPLHTFPEYVDIVGASLDPSHRLLAFTRSEVTGDGRLYRTSVAEICPSVRTFKIDGLLERSFHKAQFIHPSLSDSYTKAAKWKFSNLLVIVDRSTVLTLTIDNRGTQRKQPKVEIMVAQQSWYQWDPDHQWLYTARFKETSKIPGELELECHSIQEIGTALKWNLEFSVTLPLTINTDSFSSSQYIKNPVALTLPSEDLNMQVFSRKNSFTCVCLQHPSPEMSQGRYFDVDDAAFQSNSKKSFLSNIPDNTQAVAYSIYLLHSGIILQGQASMQPSLFIHPRMNFLFLKGYVAVYIPNQMFHLMNIGCRGDAVGNHFIESLDLSFSPTLLGDRSDNESQSVFQYHPITLQSVNGHPHSNQLLIETNSEIFFAYSLNEHGLVDLFKSSFVSLPSKLSALYGAVVLLQDAELTRSMLEHVVHSPLNLYTNDIFTMYLMAAAFAGFTQKSDLAMAKLISSSGSMTMQGLLSKADDGKRQGQVTVTWSDAILKSLRTASSVNAEAGQGPNKSSHISTLLHLTSLCQPTLIERFNLINLAYDATQTESAPALEKSSSGTKLLLNLFWGKSSSSAPTLTTSYDRPDLNFLKEDSDMKGYIRDQQNSLFKLVCSHLSASLKVHGAGSQSSKAVNLAEKYTSECFGASKELLKIIWNALGLPNYCVTDSHFLGQHASAEEVILFQLLEAYQYAHLQLQLLVPSGFYTLFATYAFRSLESHVFLQYVKVGAVRLTKSFIESLVSPEQEIAEDIIVEMLLELPALERTEALIKWNCPLARHLLERDHQMPIKSTSSKKK